MFREDFCKLVAGHGFFDTIGLNLDGLVNLGEICVLVREERVDVFWKRLKFWGEMYGL